MSLDFLWNFLFPITCLGCRRPGAYICLSCEKTIPFVKIPCCPVCERPSPYGLTHPRCHRSYGPDGLFVLADYQGLIKKAVHKFKYRGVYKLAENLSSLLINYYPLSFIKFDLYTSIPLHSHRLRERGFNQSELLAQKLALFKNVPYQETLERMINTTPQMSIKDVSKRQNNLRGAFSLLNNISLKDKNIAIVDDVATTGATLFEGIKVLKRNGAGKVWGIVLCRKQGS